MKPSNTTLFFYHALPFLFTTWTLACSVETDSEVTSLETKEARLSQGFNDCVIDNVLKRIPMDESKARCLDQAQKSCGLNSADKNSIDSQNLCLELLGKATQIVMQRGYAVDCDSGYCTILLK